MNELIDRMRQSSATPRSATTVLDYWDPVPIKDHFIRGRFTEATEEVTR